MSTPIDRELTAPPAYTPFGGYARLDRLVKGLGRTDRRTVVWAFVLNVVAVLAFSALWVAGYRLAAAWALLVARRLAAVAERQSVGDYRPHVAVRVDVCRSYSPQSRLGRLARLLSERSRMCGICATRASSWFVYTPIRGLTAATAGLVAWKLVPSPTSFGLYLLASLVASVALVASEGALGGDDGVGAP